MSKRKDEENLSKELEDLLKETETAIVGNSAGILPSNEEQLKEFENTTKIKNETFFERARKSVCDIASLYLKKEHIEKYEYVRAKMETDVESFKELLIQMYYREEAANLMFKEIKVMGNVHHRYLEVFDNFLDKSSVMSTKKNDFMFALEESYKKLKLDLEFKEATENLTGNTNESKNGLMVHGMKELIKTLGESSIGIELIEPVMDVPRDPTVTTKAGESMPYELKNPEEQMDDTKLIETVEIIESYFS